MIKISGNVGKSVIVDAIKKYNNIIGGGSDDN